MPASPRLSVVVPTRDTRELTLRCLASFLEANPPGAETILVDDGCLDGTTEAVAARFPEVLTLRHPEPRGFTASANLGISRARGEVVLLLNSDTEMEPAAIPTLLAAFDARPRLGAAGAALCFFDGRPQWSGGREPTSLWLFALASGLGRVPDRVPGYRRLRPLAAGRQGRVDWVSGAAMALRRAALDQVGPLSEAFSFYCQDLEICSRLRRAGFEIDVLPEFRVRHHAGVTIGRSAGAVRGVNPSLLWSDLVRFARLSGGPARARSASRALRAGARLRILARLLGAPFLDGAARGAWKRDTTAFRDALRALAELESAPNSDAARFAVPPKLL